MQHKLEFAPLPDARQWRLPIAYAGLGVLLLRGQYSGLSETTGLDPIPLTFGIAALMGFGASFMRRRLLDLRRLDAKIEWDEWGVTESIGGTPIIAIPWHESEAQFTEVRRRQRVAKSRYADRTVGGVMQISGANATITVAWGSVKMGWLRGRQCFLRQPDFSKLRSEAQATVGSIEPDARGRRRSALTWLGWAGHLAALAAVWLPMSPFFPELAWHLHRPVVYFAIALLYARAWPPIQEQFALKREAARFASAPRLQLSEGSAGMLWATDERGTQVQLDLDGAPLRDARLHMREGQYRVVAEASRGGGAFRGSDALSVEAIESQAESDARKRLDRAAAYESLSRVAFASFIFWLLMELAYYF